MLTPKMKKTLATLVAFLAFACAAFAAERTLPTPPASSFPDTESSLNVPLPDWPTLGRRITLSLAASFTPSNCVQIAFGQDTDSDGVLAPEETHLVLGVDCNVPFIREEFGQWRSDSDQWRSDSGQWRSDSDQWRSDVLIASEQEPTLDCQPPPPPSTFTFAFKQPSPLAARLTHAKITTRGRGESAAHIAAEIRKPGKVLFLR